MVELFVFFVPLRLLGRCWYSIKVGTTVFQRLRNMRATTKWWNRLDHGLDLKMCYFAGGSVNENYKQISFGAEQRSRRQSIQGLHGIRTDIRISWLTSHWDYSGQVVRKLFRLLV